MKTLSGLAAAAALALGGAAPAAAAQYVVTYSGVISSGSDLAGAFGGGTDLAGATASLVFTYAYPDPGAQVISGPNFSLLFGGSQFGTANPIAASAIVNGVEVVIEGLGYYGETGRLREAPDSDFRDAVVANTFDEQDENYANGSIRSVSGFLPTLDLGTTFSYTVQSGDETLANFQGHAVNANSQTLEVYNGVIALSSVSAVQLDAGAVPEPAAWALLILGFGAVGGAMRGRQGVMRPTCA